MRQFILTIMTMISISAIGQDIYIPSDYRTLSKGIRLKSFDSKGKAIRSTLHIMDANGYDTTYTDVNRESMVPIFTFMRLDDDSHAIVVYVVEYKDVHDSVFQRIKNKDLYFFTFEESDGSIIDLYYEKP